MTNERLDGILYRADTCPNTVSADEARAATLACEERGWPIPDSLKLVLLLRLLEA